LRLGHRLLAPGPAVAHPQPLRLGGTTADGKVAQGRGRRTDPGPTKNPVPPYRRHGAVERGHDSFQYISRIHPARNQTELPKSRTKNVFPTRPVSDLGRRPINVCLWCFGWGGHWAARSACIHLLSR